MLCHYVFTIFLMIRDFKHLLHATGHFISFLETCLFTSFAYIWIRFCCCCSSDYQFPCPIFKLCELFLLPALPFLILLVILKISIMVIFSSRTSVFYFQGFYWFLLLIFILLVHYFLDLLFHLPLVPSASLRQPF